MNTPVSKVKTNGKVGRPSRESAERLQQQLLETALEVFLRVGYEAASLNNIAKISGISRDTIYRQYKTKAALFQAATSHAFEEMSRHLEGAIDASRPPEEVLGKVIRYIHQDTADPHHNQVIRLTLSESFISSDMADHVLEGARLFLSPLSTYLAEQKQRGILQLGDPEEASLILASMVAGGGRFFVGRPHDTAAESEAWCDQMLDWILHGLKRA